MILALFLPVLESIMNRALRDNPTALRELAALSDCIIQIECTDWKMTFYIMADKHGVQLHQSNRDPVHTIVRGTLNHFLNLLVRGASTKTLFEYPIEITGRTKNIEILQSAFKNCDLDLEEKLSHVLGDSLAHQIFRCAKKTNAVLRDSACTVVDQTKTFVHCETKSLLSKKRAKQFYAEVRILRDDVDRLSARIDRLQQPSENAQ